MDPRTAGIARRVAALAGRVGRLMPKNHDPESFFVDRGEVEAELMALARELAPGPLPAPNPRGTFEAGPIAARGRIVRVEVRRARGRNAR